MDRPGRVAAEILSTHTPALFEAAVSRVVARLQAGEVVALPTETVYGLAAKAQDAAAVARLFAAKDRPGKNPVIVHVADVAMARRCVAEWPSAADQLAAAFWPGPLTLVLTRSAVIPDVVTAGGSTVGVRWPRHPFIQAVIRACGFPLAAPSANRSSAVSPTNAEHVRRALGDRVGLIVDGGQAQVGIESTVVDLTAKPPRVLRPGMIHADALGAVIGAVVSDPRPGAGPLRSPGQLAKHYSPKARLEVWEWRDETELEARLAGTGQPRAAIRIIAHTRIPLGSDMTRVSVIPRDAEAFARAIYGELHRCDEAGARLIVVEALPPGAEWQGIVDRLTRASA